MLGQNQTTNFQIGNAEIRIGTMVNAGKLTQTDSVGLLQSASVKVNQESVDLEAGLPKTLVDTAVVRSAITVEAQAYEFTRKNILALTGGDLGSPLLSAVAVSGTTTSVYSTLSAANAATSLVTNIAAANISVGDIFIVYSATDSAAISTVKVLTVTGTTNATITFAAQSLRSPVASGDKLYRANQIPLGGNTVTNYFNLDVWSVDHTSGKPTGFRFWKAAVSGGLDYSFSNDNFAVTPMTFKILMPSAADVAAITGTSNPVIDSATLQAHPFGMFIGG